MHLTIDFCSLKQHTPWLRWRLAISISWCLCYCFDVTLDITIVKTDKPLIHYSVQRDTSVEHEPSRNTPATSLITPQQLSHFTFSRPLSPYVQFQGISTQSHSIIILTRVRYRPTQALYLQVFNPIFTYLKSKPLRDRRWACLPELLKLGLFDPVSLVPGLYTLSGFKMSRWQASHTNVIPLWRLHELVTWYKDH